MDRAELKNAAKILKALAHEHRLELFLNIAGQTRADFESNCSAECFISEIKQLFNIGAPTLSHHLKELSNAGLISTEKRGKNVVATANFETVHKVMSLLSGIIPTDHA